MTSKKDILQLWYDEVWSNGNLDMIDKLFSPDTIAEGIMPDMHMGPDDMRDLIFAVRELVGPIKVTLPIAIEQGDWLAAVMVVNTTRGDNGGPVLVTGQVMTRFDGDKMVEAYNQFDFMSFFEQLGQMPPQSIPVCMAGQQLAWA